MDENPVIILLVCKCSLLKKIPMNLRNTYLYKPINEFSPLKFQRRDTDLGLAILYIFICEAGFLGVNGLLPKRA